MSTAGDAGSQDPGRSEILETLVRPLDPVQEDPPNSTGKSRRKSSNVAESRRTSVDTEGKRRASASTGGRRSSQDTDEKPASGGRKHSVNVGKQRRRSTRVGPKMAFPRRQSKKQSIVHVFDDGVMKPGLIEDSISTECNQEVELCQGKTKSSKKYRFMEKEDLKVEIYRDHTGRRAAFDLGKRRRRRAAMRQKQAIEAHKARGLKAAQENGRTRGVPSAGGPRKGSDTNTKKPSSPEPDIKPAPMNLPLPHAARGMRRASLVSERRASFMRDGPGVDNEVRRASVVEYGPRKLLPNRPKLNEVVPPLNRDAGLMGGQTDKFEVNYHGMALMSREQTGLSSMMKMMDSVDKKPSNCKILVPVGNKSLMVNREDNEASREKISHMTADQIKAFREVFDLFDRNGGGTIDADELDNTLRSVGICLSKDEINEVLQTIDKDGNGEIDFDEFLLLMTNTERFIENLAANNPGGGGSSATVHNENRLFEAFTEFMKKSAIDSMNEIVDYYSTKVKRFQAPHVVNHYAAGARLIGLTEKQLKEHLDRLNATNASTGGFQSPYAQPLPLVVSNTKAPPVRKRNPQKEAESKAGAEKKKRGLIQLKIKLRKVEDETSSIKTAGDNKSTAPRSEYDSTERYCSSWESQRTEHTEVRLPPTYLQKLEPFDELTADDLPFIHDQVNHATREFWRELRRTQWLENLDHWEMLDAHLITPRILRHHFRDIFSHYTTINRARLTFDSTTYRFTRT